MRRRLGKKGDSLKVSPLGDPFSPILKPFVLVKPYLQFNKVVNETCTYFCKSKETLERKIIRVLPVIKIAPSKALQFASL